MNLFKAGGGKLDDFKNWLIGKGHIGSFFWERYLLWRFVHIAQYYFSEY